MRPHLQNIDNVPLLVPLFTDCTPESEYRGGGYSASPALVWSAASAWAPRGLRSDVGFPRRERRNLGWEELGVLRAGALVARSRESEVTVFIRCSRNWGQDGPKEGPVFPCLLLCPGGLCPAPHVGLACLTLVPPDSAPSAMCEMIKIMQEYGEVTCCLGSSANLRNSCLFLQSDIRSA